MAYKVLGGVDNGGQRLINVANPTQATDAVNLQTLQDQINARSPKDDVVVRVNTNVNLASPGATLDGITMSAGMRFIASGQTTGSQNGIYVWNGAAVAATRAPDADTIQKLSGAVVAVQRGTDEDKLFLVTNDDTDTLGTTTINFVQTGTGTTYTADANGGLQLTGTVFALKPDTSGNGSGLLITASGVKVDETAFGRGFAANCVATTNPQTVTHNLNTLDVIVEVVEVATGATVQADVTRTGVNAVSVNFGGAPTAGQYRTLVKRV